MKSQALDRVLRTFLIGTTVSVTLLVTPWNSIDPINLPKMSLMGFLAPMVMALVIIKHRKSPTTFFPTLFVITAMFLCALFSALIFSNQDVFSGIFGTPGRNTGFLVYASLSFLMLGSASGSSQDLLRKYSTALISVGSILAIYGVAQHFGMDFFNYANAYSSDVFTTFGNPNFHSAFMGIVAAAAMTWAVFSSLKLEIKILLLAVSSASLINIWLSSEQGFLSFTAGIAAALIIFLFSNKKTNLGWSALGISLSGFTLLALGIFNLGPLADSIYKSSLQARGFYWRAALNMMLDHPFFGVGLDNFGDWYRRARTEEAAEFNAGLVANSAHSIPLDIGATGGFPLLILYLLILGLTFQSILKVVRRGDRFNVAFTSIVAAWVAYQAQSIISINQIGLGVWGWSLTGLLIGYEFNTRNPNQTEIEKPRKKYLEQKESMKASAVLVVFVTGVISFAVSLPPYVAATKFYTALQSGSATVILERAHLKPYDLTRFLYSAQILSGSKLDKQAIVVLSDAAKIYPDSFEVWQRWSQIPSASPAQIAKAKVEMKRLDPFNPDLK